MVNIHATMGLLFKVLIVNYNRIAKNVLKSLTKYGQDITLRQYSVGGSDYDPATQGTTVAMETFVDTIRKGLTTDQPGTRIGPQYGTNTKTDTLIQDSERWVYLDAFGAAPKVQDHMLFGGFEYAVADVQVTGPGGVALFYLVVLRL